MTLTKTKRTLNLKTLTELSLAQHDRLDKIEMLDEEARVVMWDERADGPLVIFSDGRRRAITKNGKLVPRAGVKVAA